MILPLLKSVIILSSFLISFLWADITYQLFDSKSSKYLFIKLPINSNISFTIQKSLLDFSISTGDLAKIDDLVDLGFFTKQSIRSLKVKEPYNIKNLKKITCHKQHCSFWLEIEKPVEINERKKLTVLLDPGHGGMDSGASYYGFLEKDITLKVAKKVATIMNSPFINVYLTRTSDSFISLKERAFIASQINPDCFISVHADAYTDPKVQGASIFIWGDQKKRQSALSQYLLNSNEDLSFSGAQSSQSEGLLPILSDLVYKIQKHNTHKLGNFLLENLAPLKLHNQEYQRAPFYVLNNPATPSVLVELGFLSHESSAKYLASSKGQESVSKMIVRGLSQYFDSVHDQDIRPKSQEYIIKKGDTLWSIAKKYKTDISSLKKRNKLQSDSLKIGQKILI